MGDHPGAADLEKLQGVKLALFSGLLLTACGPGEERQVPSVSLPDDGWQLLFDGSTLEGWEITNFGGQGDVYVQEGQIVLRWGNDLTGITRTGEFPSSNYEVSLEAMRVDGNDFFCGMTFPVGESHCSLIIGGWGGVIVGLSSINGRDASENETSRRLSFQEKRWYF